jgi:hypothetical protein
MPDDAPTNLAQTNRAQGELRYWRELPGGREMTVAVLGARFDGDKVDALVPGPGGDAELDSSFRPDFSEGGGFAEIRNPFGEDHALLLRGGTRYRSFDDLTEGEYLDAEERSGSSRHQRRLVSPRGRFRLAGSATAAASRRRSDARSSAGDMQRRCHCSASTRDRVGPDRERLHRRRAA